MRTIITLCIAISAILQPISKDPKSKRIEFLNKVFNQLETHVANPKWLETDEFKTFKTQMYDEETLNMSQDEFIKTFSQGKNNLTFTHFYLKRKRQTSSSSQNQSNETITWKEINKQTAYINAKTFNGDGTYMIKAIQNIGYETYENLIIDLRGNTGGSLDAPVILGQFLTNETIDAGYYMTRKWFVEKQREATLSDVSSFPFLKEFTLQAIRKMYDNEAAFRMVIPSHNRPVFRGNVFVLVSEYTASACEPLIDLFKKKNIATLVGSRSAGAMLSGFTFPVDEEFDVFIPIADYQTANGERIDKVGVAPDIDIAPEKALDYVLNTLIKE